MKTSTRQLFAMLVLTGILASCSSTKKSIQTTETEVPVQKIWDSNDSLSYAIGVQVATYYKNQGMDSANQDLISQAFTDVFTDSPLVITTEQSNMTIQERLQAFTTAKLDKEKAKSKVFLEENGKREGVVTLPDGLQYEIITEGHGPKPSVTDTVKANYIGTLLDGKEFDNSYKRGEPLELPLTGVIKGWTEALQLMPVGSKWKLYIPSELAYGDRGAGGAIPGGSALIFTIELLDIIHN